MRISLILSIITLISGNVLAQNSADSLFIRGIYDEALEDGQAYENLRSLCKDVGARLSGSPEAAKAIVWGEKLLNRSGFDSVYLMPVQVPHWIRGTKEIAGMALWNGKKKKLSIKTLGGSIASRGKIKGEVVEVQGFEDIARLGQAGLAGKIVFFNRPMDPKLINTGAAYGGCVNQRVQGASEAAQFGAIAVVVRSMTHHYDDEAHTGSVRYTEGMGKIPAVAISVDDADELSKALFLKQVKHLYLNINPQTLADKPSYNVIAEIKGNVSPEKVITVGGHLDSWDVGEGAHDDGAGVVHSIEALRILKDRGYKPNNTLRVVLFINEENGNNGGKRYAAVAEEKGEFHVAAIESDAGGFLPMGFTMDGPETNIAKMKSWEWLLEPYQLHLFKKGWGGVDIGPLKPQGVPLLGLRPDTQRYFDFHHSDTDVFENVHKRELELGCAAVASMVYLIDKFGWE